MTASARFLRRLKPQRFLASLPHVVEHDGLDRHDGRGAVGCAVGRAVGDRGAEVARGDGADAALVLREDHVRPQRAQLVVEDVVHRPAARELLVQSLRLNAQNQPAPRP